ncbi:hypoxanthine phosphoribosyltransferase [Riemerella anatipestifer]|uniref:Hypoxanthine phosphoribosyltransferase n=1 Tax=Riemerella anatipestifer TaxID=34085 RepID=A0A1S7DVG7_RIEAN|nr:hypoxanthine phosphoribosyltransferase [Riemerella anatipestifer]AQY23116.1 Hypoxanthine-guanine phosphoribosyltransferase [Riemerella anatipestifer]MBT0548401.1 hypoxanthine phosphoribosyltransferase [Riemerella anatipestifer]MBT0555711.1 hypoxanthine phosphoribosyltransferase [Riemerella anatipestifer]MBT0559164.1 hypoxanthine phosphoribosyltransferase [Riemerella anatipestifer]MCO4304074.1 hypoxanthine phosphoribosyltransferase [Riemerella anatipestifer]
MEKVKIHDKTFVPYLKNEEIQTYIKALALKVYEDYKDETPVFVGVLNGVIMFFSDFLKHYPGKCEVAFIQVSSYHGGVQSTGIVYTKMELTKEVEGRHIILMEDIVDTGNTIESLFEYFKNTHRPKSLRVASLLLKPEVFKKDFTIDYVAKEIPNKFVLGYGLDYDELGRNLPDLYQLEEGRINH